MCHILTQARSCRLALCRAHAEELLRSLEKDRPGNFQCLVTRKLALLDLLGQDNR